MHRCNICGMQNDVPSTYFSHLDNNGQRRDRDQRPELSRASVEFVAPGDYMVCCLLIVCCFDLTFWGLYYLQNSTCSSRTPFANTSESHFPIFPLNHRCALPSLRFTSSWSTWVSPPLPVACCSTRRMRSRLLWMTFPAATEPRSVSFVAQFLYIWMGSNVCSVLDDWYLAPSVPRCKLYFFFF